MKKSSDKKQPDRTDRFGDTGLGFITVTPKPKPAGEPPTKKET